MEMPQLFYSHLGDGLRSYLPLRSFASLRNSCQRLSATTRRSHCNSKELLYMHCAFLAIALHFFQRSYCAHGALIALRIQWNAINVIYIFFLEIIASTPLRKGENATEHGKEKKRKLVQHHHLIRNRMSIILNLLDLHMRQAAVQLPLLPTISHGKITVWIFIVWQCHGKSDGRGKGAFRAP